MRTGPGQAVDGLGEKPGFKGKLSPIGCLFVPQFPHLQHKLIKGVNK